MLKSDWPVLEVYEICIGGGAYCLLLSVYFNHGNQIRAVVIVAFQLTHKLFLAFFLEDELINGSHHFLVV